MGYLGKGPGIRIVLLIRHTLGGLSYVRTLLMSNPLRIYCARYLGIGLSVVWRGPRVNEDCEQLATIHGGRATPALPSASARPGHVRGSTARHRRACR